MAWPLVLVGIAMGISLILIKVRSPMLFSVGMYLPLETTFAIFVGGLIRGFVDKARDRRGFNEAQKARVENAGVLVAAGLIAGEALMGLFVAAVVFFARASGRCRASPASRLARPAVFAILALYLIRVPLSKAGRPGRAGAADRVM